MAVSKELYERYKKMKEAGENITLSELKAQIESEQKENVPVLNGFKSLSAGSSGYSSNSIQTSDSCSNSYSSHEANAAGFNSQNYNEYFEQNTVQSQVGFGMQQSDQGQESWTTTYSQNSMNVDKTSELYTNYSNSFNADFSVNTSSVNRFSSQNSFSSSEELRTQSVESYSNFTPNQGLNTHQNSLQSVPEKTEVPKYTGNISRHRNDIQDEVQTTKKYCLIGYPLGHSLSKYIHNAGFKSLNMDAVYEILETPPDSLVDRIKYLKTNNFAGFNVTIPLKLPVTLFLDEIDSSADIVGAVNTVVTDMQTKSLKGYNTDVIGFRNAIPDDIILAGKTAGVLGTGGAARAAITALAQSQVKQVKIFTRNIPNTIELLTFLRNKFPNVEFNSFQIERIRDLSDVNILVNTTPIGMQGRAADMTPVEESELRTLPCDAVVYDVIYNPKKTVLLKLAQKYGYKTINGVDMFIHQAVAAEQIWTGRTPDFKDMKIAALENL